MFGAIYVENSKNSKIGGDQKVDCTYASIEATCPSSCPLKDNQTCYASLGYVGLISHRLDKQSKKMSPLEVARVEAHAIDQSHGGGKVPHKRDLRLHVSGDARTIKGVRLINKAIARWKQRGGGDVWAYTHAWKHVPRLEWSNVSMLASISKVEEVSLAKENGYAPAIIVAEFQGDKAFVLPNSDTKWIPCPAQTRDIPCVKCRLCFNADRLLQGNFGIAFEAHGVRKNVIKKQLTVIK